MYTAGASNVGITLFADFKTRTTTASKASIMTNLKTLIFAATITFLSQAALADKDKFDEALKTFQMAGESGAFFEDTYAYALFPSVGKAGVGIGGAHGKGRVYREGEHIGDTKVSQLSYGLQLGGQVYSQIIFFEDERALRDFTSGNFEFGAQASATAITASANAQASTGGGNTAGASGGKSDAKTVSTGYDKGMAIFTVTKGGLMYEAAIAGQKFSYTPL